MKKLKINYYDSNIHDAVDIGDLELTDKEYENLDRIAKSWKMSIQEAFRVIISSGLRELELDT